MNTKDKGNIGIGAAIAHFTSEGQTVCIPLTDSQEYDLIVDKDGKLLKVQVKYTAQRAPSGRLVVELRSVSGSSREVYATVKDTGVDLLFVYTDEVKLLIPTAEITSKNTITITETVIDKYRI